MKFKEVLQNVSFWNASFLNGSFSKTRVTVASEQRGRYNSVQDEKPLCPGPSSRFDRCTIIGEHCHCYLSEPMHLFEPKLIILSLREMTVNIISQILVHVKKYNVKKLDILYSQLPHNLYREILIQVQVLARGNCICALINRK